MLRYAVESHPNTKMRTIHVERKLPSINWYESSSEKMTPEARKLKEQILKIDGVTEVTARDYSMHVTRGGVFTWDEILPKCVAEIQRLMSVGEMTEVPAFAE